MEYVRPRNIKATLKMMKKWKGRVTLIAGGTNVIPDMRAKFLDLF